MLQQRQHPDSQEMLGGREGQTVSVAVARAAAGHGDDHAATAEEGEEGEDKTGKGIAPAAAADVEVEASGEEEAAAATELAVVVEEAESREEDGEPEEDSTSWVSELAAEAIGYFAAEVRFRTLVKHNLLCVAVPFAAMLRYSGWVRPRHKAIGAVMARFPDSDVDVVDDVMHISYHEEG